MGRASQSHLEGHLEGTQQRRWTLTWGKDKRTFTCRRPAPRQNGWLAVPTFQPTSFLHTTLDFSMTSLLSRAAHAAHPHLVSPKCTGMWVRSYKGFVQTPLFSHPSLWCWTAFFNSACPYLLVSSNPFIQGSLVDSIPTATVMCPMIPWTSLLCCQWLCWLFQRELEKPFKELLPLTQ